MKKHAIDAAAALLKAKDRFEGVRCSHMFYDVLYRGGPKTFEAIRSTESQCPGFYEVTTKKGRVWEWGDHKELVWRKFHHCRYCETITVVVRCPVCGQEDGYGPFKQDFSQAKFDLQDDEEIPF